MAVSFLLAVACGGAPSASVAASASSPNPNPPASPAPSPSPSAATLLLKVTSEGGFINPSANLAALPIVEVYSDGRIFTPGALPTVSPGPLLPGVDVREVGPDGEAAIVAAIKGAGLDQPATTGQGIPGDAGSDVFLATFEGQTTETRLAAGGPPGPGRPGGPGADGSGDPERGAAFDLLNRLLDQTQTWGAASAPVTPYAPTAYQIYVAPGAPASDPSTAQASVGWPLSAGLDAFGIPAVPDRGIAGLRQGVAFGADAVTLRPILSAATLATGFISGGKTYTLYVRPLLPDDLGG